MVRLNGASGTDTAADQRAAAAEAAVLGRFVGRLFHLPGTLMARTVASASEARPNLVVDRSTPFHYWWQAHLMDAIVDGGLRRLRQGDTAGAKHSARLAQRLLITIILRNRGTLRNHYFDDMAWLALSVQRLAALHGRLGIRARMVPPMLAQRTLSRELRSGRLTDGGVFWNKDRHYRNAATAGPTALYLARSGRLDLARTTVEWLYQHLLDDRGLLLDGLLLDGTRVDDIYTYNQGPTLSALLELGGPEDLERAAALIRAVGVHLTTTVDSTPVLITHGDGDGGLFTGILVRHLALAARDQRLDAATRQASGELVRSTANLVWKRRDQGGRWPIFPTVPAPTGGHDQVELSAQLQGWMVMEAVATLNA